MTHRPLKTALKVNAGGTALALLALGLASCGAARTPGTLERVRSAAASSGVTDLRVETLPGGGVSVTGKLSGNPFAARFPSRWNGSSVISAHGYVTPDQPEPLPDLSDPVLADATPGTEPSLGLFPAALAQGYAVADTAYAKTGYAVKEGVAANKALHDFLAAAGSKRQYLSGISMGGNVAVALAEKYPSAFAGTLSLCGVVAGWRAEERYLLDFRVVYDSLTKSTSYALPGAGDALTPNPAYTRGAVVNSVVGLFTAASKGDRLAKAIIGQISAVTQAPADPISFITPLASAVYGLADYLGTAGGPGYSNEDKVYAGSLNDAALNRGVQRIKLASGDTSASFLAANYTPTGRFRTRMLTLHNLSDPLVPYLLEPEFRRVVAAAGNSANLVQQVVDARAVNLADPNTSGPSHCSFTPGQVRSAWNELRGWVERGVRPVDGANISGRS